MSSTIQINHQAVSILPSSSTHQPHQKLASVRRFHQQVLPGYRPSPLHPLLLGTSISGDGSSRFRGKVYLKDESNRYGLPAFKVLGAAYASFVALCESWILPSDTTSLNDLRAHAKGKRTVLVTATDGNHGRAVAFFANLVGIRAQIFIPNGVSLGAEAAIDREGPNVTVTRLQEDYDECVRHAARFAEEACDQERVLIQDTAWQGYTQIPQLIVDGYQTIFKEVEEQLPSGTTHVLCPVGVGSLAQAAVQFYTSEGATSPQSMAASIVAVEPVTAACLAKSIAEEKLTSIETGETVMAGLNCGTPSLSAWPFLKRGIQAVVTISDERAMEAAQWLKSSNNGGIVAGPCGAAPLAALQVLLDDMPMAEKLGLLDDDQVKVVLLMTEGDVSAIPE